MLYGHLKISLNNSSRTSNQTRIKVDLQRRKLSAPKFSVISSAKTLRWAKALWPHPQLSWQQRQQFFPCTIFYNQPIQILFFKFFPFLYLPLFLFNNFTGGSWIWRPQLSLRSRLIQRAVMNLKAQAGVLVYSSLFQLSVFFANLVSAQLSSTVLGTHFCLYGFLWADSLDSFRLKDLVLSILINHQYAYEVAATYFLTFVSCFVAIIARCWEWRDGPSWNVVELLQYILLLIRVMMLNDVSLSYFFYTI